MNKFILFGGIIMIFLVAFAISDSLEQDLVTYYNFNESSGVLIDIANGEHNGTVSGTVNRLVPGIIDRAYNFSNTGNVLILDDADFDFSSEISIAYWINFSTALESFDYVFMNKYDSSSGYRFLLHEGGGAEDFAFQIRESDTTPIRSNSSSTALTVGAWTHVVGVANGSDVMLFLDGNLIDKKEYDGTIGTNNNDININITNFTGQEDFILTEMGFWSKGLTEAEVETLYNSGNGLAFPFETPGNLEVTLNSPANDSTLAGVITFNASFTPGDVNLTNATIFVWDNSDSLIAETTNEVLGGKDVVNETTWIIPNLPIGDNKWNVLACGNNESGVAVCNMTDENRTVTFGIVETDSFFNNITTEGNVETFAINVTVPDGSAIALANLHYNNSIFSGVPVSAGGNNYTSTVSLSAPILTAYTNISFFWNITLQQGLEFNSDLANQTVNPLNVDDCSSYTNLLYNYSLLDEELQTPIGNNTTMEIALNLYDSTGETLILNFSQAYQNINPAQVCLESALTNEVYSVDSTVKYFANETTTNRSYVIEYYNIRNTNLSNDTIPNNINLYDLNAEDATDFQLTFKNNDLVRAPDVLVYVYRQYVSDNDFKVVEVPITDNNGQTVVHMVRNDIVYNLVMADENNTVLATFNNLIAFCDDFTIGECTINLNAPISIIDIFDYDEDFGISFTQPTFSNVTNFVSMTFLSDDLNPVEVEMEVIRNGGFGNRSVCSDSLTSVSGTLSCNASSVVATDTFLFVNIYVDGDLKTTLPINLQGDSFGFGVVEGSFFAFFAILFLITITMENKKVLLVSLIIGWALVLAIGLVRGALFGSFAGGIWLIISIFIMLWKIGKEDRG